MTHLRLPLSPLSSRYSHPFASAHSRFTVAGDMPITAAVSSTVRPAEEAQLDDPRLLGIERFEPGQRAIEREQVDRHPPSCAGAATALVERHDAAASATCLTRRSRRRVVDQDPPHQLRGDREEVRAVLPVERRAGPIELQVRLVDEGRRL